MTFVAASCFACVLLFGFDDEPAGQKPKAKEAKRHANEKEPNDSNFSGVIVENGKTRKFTDRAEFDKALRRKGGRGVNLSGPWGQNRAGSFRGTINENGKVTVYKDQREWLKAQQRMQRRALERMRSGFGRFGGEPFDSDDEVHANGLVVKLTDAKVADQLWNRSRQLVDGKLADRQVSPNVRVALGKEEIEIELHARADATALLSACLAAAKLDENARSNATTTETAVVVSFDDAKACNALCDELFSFLTKQQSVGDRPADLCRATITKDKVVIQFQGDAALKQARKIVQE